MTKFSHENERIVLVGHEQLRRFGYVSKGKYVLQTHRTSARSWKRWADNVIPPGHLENGGIVIVAMNYPTNVHWIWGALTGCNPPVMEIRNDSMTEYDPWALAASTYMCNSFVQVRHISFSSFLLMAPYHSCSHVIHTQILKARYPALDRIIVNRKRCVHHPMNACGLHVIAQTMLFAEGKENTHRVTKAMVRKLRFFIIHFLRQSANAKYSLPKWK